MSWQCARLKGGLSKASGLARVHVELLFPSGFQSKPSQFDLTKQPTTRLHVLSGFSKATPRTSEKPWDPCKNKRKYTGRMMMMRRMHWLRNFSGLQCKLYVLASLYVVR